MMMVGFAPVLSSSLVWADVAVLASSPWSLMTFSTMSSTEVVSK